MGHIHNVYDSNIQFTINPITRAIKNESPQKTTLIQNDHNSERFTFSIQRHIEGHDMSLCNKVEVHYLNVDKKGTDKISGIYTVEDLAVKPEDEDTVVLSWLISQSCTKYAGDLNFLLRFCCVEDGTTTYAWNTDIYKNIKVGSSIDGGELFETEYIDIIEQWKKKLTALNISVDVVQDATKGANEAATAANRATEAANEAADKANNAADTLGLSAEEISESGFVATLKETNNGNMFTFWTGKQKEYDDKKDSISPNTLCIIEDDTSEEEIYRAINTKAPAGYGLGAAVQKNWSEVDSLTSPGWYKFATNSEILIGGYGYKYAYMRVDAYNEKHACQTLSPVSNLKFIVTRWRHDGIWDEWEFDNPPMQVGVEYRTTDKVAGLPIYTKLIHFGVLPSSGTAEIKVDTPNLRWRVDYRIISGSSNEFLDKYISRLFLSETTLSVTTTITMNNFQAYIQVWYTKTTD